MVESISKGVLNARLSAKGSGETDPIAPNKSAAEIDNPEGRVKNKRTEFKVIRRAKERTCHGDWLHRKCNRRR